MTNRIKLGIERDDPGNYQTRLCNREKKVIEALRDDPNVVENFDQALTTGAIDQVDGTVYTGAAAEVLGFNTGKHQFEAYVNAVATGAAVAGPYQSVSGLELISLVAGTGPSAWEITNGVTALSKTAYIVGTDIVGLEEKIFFEANILIDDISDITEVWMGFRKAEAYQTDPDDYDEMAAFNIGEDADGQIEIHTIINNASTDNVDTTETDWANGKAYRLRIEVNGNGDCKFLITSAGATAAAAALLDLAEPTVTKEFAFDADEVIVPFLTVVTETGDPGLSISNWTVGRM